MDGRSPNSFSGGGGNVKLGHRCLAIAAETYELAASISPSAQAQFVVDVTVREFKNDVGEFK